MDDDLVRALWFFGFCLFLEFGVFLFHYSQWYEVNASFGRQSVPSLPFIGDIFGGTSLRELISGFYALMTVATMALAAHFIIDVFSGDVAGIVRRAILATLCLIAFLSAFSFEATVFYNYLTTPQIGPFGDPEEANSEGEAAFKVLQFTVMNMLAGTMFAASIRALRNAS